MAGRFSVHEGATNGLEWRPWSFSVIHVTKGPYAKKPELDGKTVETITAFLFHRGGHEDPERLLPSANKSFQGSIVLGMGFTFDDTDTKGIASPIAEMHRLIAKDPHNAERIFPYIGGEEVNTSPTHAYHRYVISFGEMTEVEARRWPDLMTVLEDRVKPERAKLAGNPDADRRREHWWLWGRYTPALFDAIGGLERILVISRVGNAFAFCFLPARIVPSERLVVFPMMATSSFAVMQSRVHEIWARFFSATLKDDLMYAPSDCFETFPFPKDFETEARLETPGKHYYEFRAQLMVNNNEGLTKTYNRFHDPNEGSPEFERLRELHAAMDCVVLDTYGWTDLQPTCEFLLDYEEEEDDESQGRHRKKPWRYRWPDDFRDEVLARLLELNKQRAEEERLAGVSGSGKRDRSRNRRSKRSGDAQQRTLSGI